MKVNVLYPKRNFSSFDYGFNQKITERVYDENDKFVKRVDHTPSLEHYVVVGKHDVDMEDTNEILQGVVMQYNVGKHPQRITEEIRSGKLNVEFSSFSTGCVVQIDDTYYISNGMTFDELPESFSN